MPRYKDETLKDIDVCVIIPARFKSSRFPGKPLIKLCGREMILWVCERSADAVGDQHVYVATDDKRIASLVESAGFSVLMTGDALTGTDRVAEAAKSLSYEYYVNVQGDEPLVNPADIVRAIKRKKLFPDSVINGYARILKDQDPRSVNIPKVVFNAQGELLYMSRSLIPGSKASAHAPTHYFKQICIYVFNKLELDMYKGFEKKSELECCEDIEILRFFELGVPIQMFECEYGTLAVDIPEDVSMVESAMKRSC